MTNKSETIIATTERFGAHNYHPLPVVLATGEGIYVTDVEGRQYMDFLSAYSAVNQGHRHPHIIEALKKQADRLTLTSRAFHNDLLGTFLERLCTYTGFEMALPMNTGAEAVETALKMARRWGAIHKGITDGEQEIIVCKDNFHGRTISIISMSTDLDCRTGFGPFTPGFQIVDYDDISAIEKVITKKTCAILLEPIQGEAGVNIPSDGYLKGVRKLCDHYQILWIDDEIQTGFCRTGKKFAVDHEGVVPDVMTLGKALGGGVFPVSAVVASKDVMSVFTPGSHGSTFGGNPLGCAVGIAALDVLENENLATKSNELGAYFVDQLKDIACKEIVAVRGRGLLIAVEFEDNFEAWDVCVALRDSGILAKQTHGHIIRFSPPLVITRSEVDEALARIRDVFSKIGQEQ